MEKLVLLIFFSSFLIGENIEFNITFLGINSASVFISEKDTVINGKNAKSIIFETQTVAGVKTLFPVDNYYHTIINEKFNRILYFNKRTSQPWVKNNFSAKMKNGIIKYENSEIEIQSGYQNIFTLLQYLNHISINELIKSDYLIDREGMHYLASFELINSNDHYNEIQLFLHPINSIKNIPIVKNTDIFTWEVFKENSERILRINKKTGKLIYCEFSSGIVTMKANLIEN
ncbi:MAG: hypothetical protein H8E60_04835 [Candidatus Marinimicrobia bacterium]|nr:hypothetical protein [Candidatus Neomarinimicrobiota bacterium]